MTRVARSIRAVLFPAAVAAALAFGASQALATPETRSSAPGCPSDCRNGGCDCDAYCTSIGGIGGVCNGRFCQCFFP